ncbi:MAG: Cys-tRNA(Pro) deacylase [Sandaracinaceae bacterium]
MSDRLPVTPAIRALRAAKVAYAPHLYEYVERGGTRVSAEALGVDEYAVVKTLVFEDDAKRPLIVLMHGDREVSAKGLARLLGQKSIRPCDPKTAERHSGYQVGGTSPFGTKKPMPIYVEASILELPAIYINGGKRGFLVEIDPRELVRVLGVTPVSVATAG